MSSLKKYLSLINAVLVATTEPTIKRKRTNKATSMVFMGRIKAAASGRSGANILLQKQYKKHVNAASLPKL